MKKKISFVNASLLFILPLSAAHNTLRIKNKTNQPIEFILYTTTGTGFQGKTIEAHSKAQFSLDISTLEGIDWKIASPQNPKCKDWFKLDKKSSVIASLRAQGLNGSLTVEENGGFQSVIGKSIQKIDNMKPYSGVCSSK